MKKQSIILILLLSFLVFNTACDKFATNVDPLIDQVEDDRLTSEDQIQFVINGVHTRFTDALDVNTLLSDILSDELIFDERVPNATYPQFREIDTGDILRTNNSIDGSYDLLGELRFFADNLIERIGNINFSDENLEAEAYYYGYFYGGVARMFYAAYYGLDETTPGGVIDAGPFIPAAEMYDKAAEKFAEALDYADAYQTEVVNTLLARMDLYQNDYTSAAAYAADGLMEGDDPYQAKYTIEDANYWWTQGGRGRSQVVLDFRFKDYVDEDPAEAARVLLDPILGSDSTTFYRQGKYLKETSPFDFVSWQENYLMLAECALKGATTDQTALDYVNAVRSSHGLADLDEVDMDVLMEERDKELMCTGTRAPDQLRWDIWHLKAGLWQYLCIPESEFNANPNLTL